MALVQFKELRSLDWRGLTRHGDFESVKECIKAHGHRIQSLTLDLLSSNRAIRIWNDGFHQRTFLHGWTNSFAQKVLNVQPGDQKNVFLTLESLHLAVVSFYYAGMEMAYTFNVEILKSLKLRNCPGSLDWLQPILNSGKKMSLKSLELAFDMISFDRSDSMHITETVSEFIHHNYGSETLCLMLPEPTGWATLTDTISSHCHLKRLTIHSLVNRGGYDLIDGNIPWAFEWGPILQERKLTCFGSSIPPGDLVCINHQY